MTGHVVALAALLLGGSVLAFVLQRRGSRSVAVAAGTGLTAAELGVRLGATATVVQFSSPACAPCRAARRLLGEVTTTRPDVVHVDLDAAAHLDLVRRHGVLTTPTLLVLDASGTVRRRLTGTVDRPHLDQALTVAASAAPPIGGTA